MKGYIYKITNTSGSIYIGKTTNYKSRFRHYRNLTCKTQPALYRSLLKYGWSNHIVEIIDECCVEVLSEKEMYYIDKFNSFKCGLNCTKGGDGGFMTGDNNISHRPEVKEKYKKSIEKYWLNNTSIRLGSTHTDDIKEVIKYHRSIQEPIVRVLVLDLETGVCYNGIKELADEIGINYKAFHNQLKNTKKWNNKYIIHKIPKDNTRKRYGKELNKIRIPNILDLETGIFYFISELVEVTGIPRTTFYRNLGKKNRYVICDNKIN